MPTGHSRSPLRQLLPPLLLAGISLALFSFGITAGHLQLDDWGYTAGCPFVASGLSAANVTQAFANLGHGGIWMPLTYVTYMADISFFGGGWTVHHATNVVLHATNAVLAYAFLLTLLRRLRPDARHLPLACFLAALIWAVHPMRAEAVVWIASRKEELWSLFALLASMAWIRFLDRRTVARYAIALVAFVFACLSKPTAVCLPLVLFALEGLVGASPRKWLKYVPLLFVSAFVGLVAIHSQAHPTGTAAVDVFGTSFLWRLANAAVSLGMYVWHTLVPFGIHMDYRAMPNALPLDAALGLSVLGLALAAAVFALVRTKGPARRLLICVLALFAITLLPVLGVIGFTGDKAYADRYMYLPTVTLLPVLAAALDAAIARRGKPRIAIPALLVAAALAAAALPVIRSFRDDARAYRRVLACDPDHWRALRVLGNLRCTQPDGMDEGVAMLRRSLALRPSQITASSLAYVLAIRGQADDFRHVKDLGRPVALRPALDREGLMLDALGIVSMREGNDANAAKCFYAALRAPARSHAAAHTMLNLGLTLANCGKTREALAVLQRVRATCDGNVRMRAEKAIAVLQDGRTDRFTWSAE